MNRLVVLALLLATLPASYALTLDEVIALHQAGLSSDTIRAQIEVTGVRYQLAAADLVRLKEAGVPEDLIQAMIRTAAPPVAEQAARHDAGLARQIGEIRAALAEPPPHPIYSYPARYYWDEPTYGYLDGGFGYYGFPVVSRFHYAPFFRAGHTTVRHSHFSPGIIIRRGGFTFVGGTNFSRGGSFFRFSFR